MKNRIAIILLFILGSGSMLQAQDNEVDYVEFNDRNNVVHGVYLGLTMHYGEIESKDTFFTGLKIAYVANQQFEIGFAGSFFYSDQNIYRGISAFDEDLIGGYGGLHLEPIFFSKSLVSLSFPVMIGAGGMGYIDDNFNKEDFDEQEFEDNAQAFFIIEPGINALFNVSRYLQLEAGMRYRITSTVNDTGGFDPIKRINGFSAGVGIKVGVFNMGRNRYKKNR